MALFTTALVELTNTAALAALVHALLNGKAAGGPTLLIDALNIWGTHVVIFALWFWTTECGGAALRGHPSARDPDFPFQQMTLPQQDAAAPVRAGLRRLSVSGLHQRHCLLTH
jgi:hypothetical protein